MSACGSLPTAIETGKEDVGYLVFVTQSKYSGATLNVKVDNTEFAANPVKAKKSTYKGTGYSVQPGKRHITVTDSKGNVIYQKYLFISTQESKQIQLP